MTSHLVLLAVALVGAVFFGWKAVQRWKRRHLLVDTPPVPVAELRSGFQQARGRIVGAGQEVVAPVSHRVCVYYRLTVEEHRQRGGKNKGRDWVTLVTRTHSTPIEIEDESGRVRIEIGNAEVWLELDRHLSSGLLSSFPEELVETLQADFGVGTKGLVFNKTMRVRETILEQGDELHVIGQVTHGRDGAVFDRGGPLFLVSDKGASRMIGRETRALVGWVVMGLAVVGAALALAATTPRQL